MWPGETAWSIYILRRRKSMSMPIISRNRFKLYRKIISIILRLIRTTKTWPFVMLEQVTGLNQSNLQTYDSEPLLYKVRAQPSLTWPCSRWVVNGNSRLENLITRPTSSRSLHCCVRILLLPLVHRIHWDRVRSVLQFLTVTLLGSFQGFINCYRHSCHSVKICMCIIERWGELLK